MASTSRFPLLQSFNVKGNYKLMEAVEKSKSKTHSKGSNYQDEVGTNAVTMEEMQRRLQEHKKEEKMRQFHTKKGCRGDDSVHGIKVASGEVLFSHETASEGTHRYRNLNDNQSLMSSAPTSFFGNRKDKRGESSYNHAQSYGQKARSMNDLRKETLMRLHMKSPSALSLHNNSNGRHLFRNRNHNSKTGYNDQIGTVLSQRREDHQSLRSSYKNKKIKNSNIDRSRDATTESQRLFMGRGVALPGNSNPPTLKKSSSKLKMQDLTHSLRGEMESRNKAANDSGSNKKWKFYSVRSLKDLFKRQKRSTTKANSDHSVGSSSIVDVSKAGMRGANSMTFPMTYSMDEVDVGRFENADASFIDYDQTPRDKLNSMSSKGKSRSTLESETDKGYSDREYEIGNRGFGYLNKEDERDWRSLSHGYGSWTSRNNQTYRSRETDETSGKSKSKHHTRQQVEDDSTTRADDIHYFKFRNRKSQMRRSFSINSLSTDYSFSEFDDNNYFTNSNLNQKKNYVHRFDSVHGNDRFSETSKIGEKYPRSSSRSRWLGQWYGPDYESSSMRSDYDDQNHNYSIKEANASFATETTAARSKLNDRYGFRPGHSSKYHYRQDSFNSMNGFDNSHERTVALRHDRHRHGINTRKREEENIRAKQNAPRLFHNTKLHGMVPLRKFNSLGSNSPSRNSIRSWKSDSILNGGNNNSNHLSQNQQNRRRGGHHLSRKEQWSSAQQLHQSRRNKSLSMNPSRERISELDVRNKSLYVSDENDDDDDEEEEFNDDDDDELEDEENIPEYVDSEDNKISAWVMSNHDPNTRDEILHSELNSQVQSQVDPFSAAASSRMSHITDYIDGDLIESDINKEIGKPSQTNSANNKNNEQQEETVMYHTEFIGRSKSFAEFDNVMETNRTERNKDRKSEKGKREIDIISNNKYNVRNGDRSSIRTHGTLKGIRHLDENFAVKETLLPRSRSVDSLIDHRLMEQKSISSAKRSLREGRRRNDVLVKAANQTNQGNLGRTDYTLLGVCNQIESLINKNLLQHVIGYKGNNK